MIDHDLGFNVSLKKCGMFGDLQHFWVSNVSGAEAIGIGVMRYQKGSCYRVEYRYEVRVAPQE